MTPLTPSELAWLTRAAENMAEHGNARDKRVGKLVLRLIRAGRAATTVRMVDNEPEPHWRNCR